MLEEDPTVDEAASCSTATESSLMETETTRSWADFFSAALFKVSAWNTGRIDWLYSIHLQKTFKPLRLLLHANNSIFSCRKRRSWRAKRSVHNGTLYAHSGRKPLLWSQFLDSIFDMRALNA